MKKLSAQLSQFEKSLANLKEVLQKIVEHHADHAVLCDSAIKRFEIVFDTAWKTVKEKLRDEYGIDTASPKKVFQEAFKQGLIENDTIWIEMTDMRNETSHVYSEPFSEEVLSKLPGVADALEQLLWKLKQ